MKTSAAKKSTQTAKGPKNIHEGDGDGDDNNGDNDDGENDDDDGDDKVVDVARWLQKGGKAAVDGRRNCVSTASHVSSVAELINSKDRDDVMIIL